MSKGLERSTAGMDLNANFNVDRLSISNPQEEERIRLTRIGNLVDKVICIDLYNPEWTEVRPVRINGTPPRPVTVSVEGNFINDPDHAIIGIDIEGEDVRYEIGRYSALRIKKDDPEKRGRIEHDHLSFLEPVIDNFIEHPEGMTSEQERLADLMFGAKVIAPIRRRLENSDGEFEFVEEEREVSIFEFATKEGDFAQNEHDINPGAPLTPIYFSFRNLPQEFLDQAAAVYDEMGKVTTDLVMGVPNAGRDLAEAFSVKVGKSSADVMVKYRDENGAKVVKVVDGVEGNGQTVTLIEDVYSTGDSVERTIQALENAGFQVREVRAIMDRQQGFRIRDGVEAKYAIALDQFINYGLWNAYLDGDQKRTINEYHEAKKLQGVTSSGQ